MIHLFSLIQLLFTAALLGGFWLWWVLDHVGHGYPPDGAFLRWWHALEGQPEFYLLIAQLTFPIYWWLTRNAGWSAFWRTWRWVHLSLVVLLILGTGLLWLATPDLSGPWG